MSEPVPAKKTANAEPTWVDASGQGEDKPVAGAADVENTAGSVRPTEVGGPAGPEPTRYGDWERKGRCIDF